MTLQSSGAISIADLNTEFGGGYSLSNYYRGGSYVPNSPANSGVPTSGAISLSNFYGAAAGPIIRLSTNLYAADGVEYPNTVVGYDSGVQVGSFGSVDSDTITPTGYLACMIDFYASVFCMVRLAGFSSDPGYGYLTEVKITGNFADGYSTKTLAPPSSYYYVYSGGTAEWDIPLFQMLAGETYAMEIHG